MKYQIFLLSLIAFLPIVAIAQTNSNEKSTQETIIEFYEGGVLKSSESKENGQLSGISCYYYQSQFPKEIKYFKSNIPDGFSLEFYENGHIKTYSNYASGRKDGWQIEFSIDLGISKRDYYTEGEIVSENEWETKNINLSFRDTIYYDSEWQRIDKESDNISYYGLKNYDSDERGLVCFFYSNGSLYSYQIEKDDLKDDYCIWFHKNGTLYSDGVYKEDLPVGTHRYFDYQGVLRSFSQYELHEITSEFTVDKNLDTVYQSKKTLAFLEGKTPKESREEARNYLLGNLKKSTDPELFKELIGKTIYLEVNYDGEIRFGGFNEGSVLMKNTELVKLLYNLVRKIPNWNPKTKNGLAMYSDVPIQL